MKKVFVVSAKILLPILFLYNIGFFNISFPKFFKEIGKIEPLNTEGQKKLVNFVHGKVILAERKGEKYSPYDYFNDLYEIEKLENSLKNVTSYHVLANRLLVLQQENMRKGLFSNYDITAARTKYKEKRDPGSIAREELRRDIQTKTFWPNLRNWLWHAYLVNLPLAFLLFLVWWYQEKKNFKISNPLSFCISLIFYPIIITLVIREFLSEKSRYFIAEAELRRTKKKMFSILSKDELEDIRRFAASRGLTLNDWRNYLNNQGFKPQGILVSSLVVTILLMAIPKFSSAQNESKTTKSNIFTDRIMTIKAEIPPGINVIDFNDSQNDKTTSSSGLLVWLFSEFDLRDLKSVFIKVWVNNFHPQEVILKIEHVPCFSF